MDFGATRFDRELCAEIKKRRDEIAVQIVSGIVTDFAHYRNLVGSVAAFEEALAMADAVRARLIKPQD